MKEIREVEIFSVGTWNGFKFTKDDLEEIVNNSNSMMLKGSLKAPIKIGHSTEQILAGQSDGDPALGWIENFKIKGQKIIADFVKVPDILLRAFKQGLYKQVSVEMKHIQETGWFLTGIAILGADIPAVKYLQDLETFLSERTAGDTAPVLKETLCFTQEKPYLFFEREKMTEEIKFAEIQERLQQIEAENAALKEKNRNVLFSEAKTKVLADFDQDVKDGKLSPAMREKINIALDAQKANFSEGSELFLPASLMQEVSRSYKNDSLPSTESSDSSDFSESGLRIDEFIFSEVSKIQANTGKDYFEASQLFFSANPKKAEEYKRFTLAISEGRI